LISADDRSASTDLPRPGRIQPNSFNQEIGGLQGGAILRERTKLAKVKLLLAGEVIPASSGFVSKCFVTNLVFDATSHELPRRRSAIETKQLDTVSQAEKLQCPNTEPVQIKLVPMETVTG
jgi:hypothetical protein